MGAPKQKWTEEEEYALKSGVVKHGQGKWRTILKDPEFCRILYLRSNVDLKDKWRNLGSSASGWGTRERARIVAMRRSQMLMNHDDNHMALSTDVREIDDDVVDVEPLAVAGDALHIKGPKISFSRLDNLIFEAITCMKQPTGSNKTAILMYIEDHYGSPMNLKEMLSAKLSSLTESGKLIKVKRHYRIAPRPLYPRTRRLLLEERYDESIRDDVKPLNSHPDADLARMRNMTAQEAAVAAAQAVAEAETAMLEAEEATREAEAAEAEAEAAQAFAEAAASTMRGRNTTKLMVRV